MLRFSDGSLKKRARIEPMSIKQASMDLESSAAPRDFFSTCEVDVCIVVFDTPWNVFETTLESLLNQDGKYHFKVIDHSLTGEYRAMVEARKFSYCHAPDNPGYGSGNNRGLFDDNMSSPYCLILNPDVVVHRHALSRMITHFNNTPSCQIVVPMVVDLGGEIQYLSRQLPRPLDLFVRRFGTSVLRFFFRQRSWHHEYRHCDHQNPLAIGSASGSCFMIRRDCFKEIKGFDERYFLYMEDLDLSRRVIEYGEIHYLPCSKITHHHTRASYHSWPYLIQHIKSALQYFSKWGWWPLI
jgi:GT2 family glycosyltransferase